MVFYLHPIHIHAYPRLVRCRLETFTGSVLRSKFEMLGAWFHQCYTIYCSRIHLGVFVFYLVASSPGLAENEPASKRYRHTATIVDVVCARHGPYLHMLHDDDRTSWETRNYSLRVCDENDGLRSKISTSRDRRKVEYPRSVVCLTKIDTKKPKQPTFFSRS